MAQKVDLRLVNGELKFIKIGDLNFEFKKLENLSYITFAPKYGEQLDRSKKQQIVKEVHLFKRSFDRMKPLSLSCFGEAPVIF
jgi:hypothetical protein